MTALVEFRGVEFAYPPAERGASRGFRLGPLDLAIDAGRIVAVIGPNSAGKTTLIRLLTRVVDPVRGAILLDGRLVAELGRRELARAVAVVHQDVPHGLPFSVGELVLMGRYPHGAGRLFESREDLTIARGAMAALDLLSLASAPVASLSGGERQRVMLARALAQQPRLLVLDEPTAHLDLRHQVECAALLRRLHTEQGLAILLVTHDLALAAELGEQVLLLGGGRVAGFGGPDDVLDEALLSAVYGCPVVVRRHASTGRPEVHVAWRAGRPEGR